MMNNKMMTRKQVYDILDNERDYQDNRWGAADDSNSIGDFMVYMKFYIDEAFKAASNGSALKTRDELRKVVALGVACFEKHGVTDRFNPLPKDDK